MKKTNETFLVVCKGSKKVTHVQSLQELSEAICHYGCDEDEDVYVFDEKRNFIFNTIGMFVDRCSDKKFLEKLLDVLIPEQLQKQDEIMK